MRPTLTQHSLLQTIVHWILALLILSLIGLGWYLQYLPPTAPAPEREFFISLHISLGLISIVLILFKILLWLILGSPSFSETIPHWEEIVIRNLYILIYVCVVLLGINGFLWAIFSTTPTKFWGSPIPVWGAENLINLDGLYGTLHEATAIALTALVVIQAGILSLSIYQQKRFIDNRPPPKRSQHLSRRVKSEIVLPILPKAVSKLVRRLRQFGWFAFWIQLGLAIIAALLLLFSTKGQAISPNLARISSGITWGIFGFALLCLTIIFFFHYPRSARKIALEPDHYINPQKKTSPWFLRLNIKLSLIGVFAGFFGMGTSISLLIAKTVSQPPGIAITDPRKIVRALDVFILLINFDLLVAHFIGGVISIWVSILASRAHTLTIFPPPLNSLPPPQDD